MWFPHNLLFATLKCYGVEKASLRLVLDYLTRRKQPTKIGSSSSSWCNAYTGVPQGSILGPLLFNIFISNLLFSIKKSEVCHFVDDDTFSVVAKIYILLFSILTVILVM